MDAKALAEVQETHVKIRRSILLKTVQKNSEKHKEDYEKALFGWRTEALKALKAHEDKIATVITRMEKDEETKAPVKGLSTSRLAPKIPPRPQDHSNEYQQILKKLEFSEDDFWYISHHDFRCFVLDEWSWKGAFTEMVSNYVPSNEVTNVPQGNYDD